MTDLRKTPARTFLVELICDCGHAMEFDGIVLTSYPAQYPHHCSACGKRENKGRAYPCYEHEPIERPGVIGAVR